jgi:hypothetical protein
MEYDRCVLDEIIMLFSLFCMQSSKYSLALGFLFTSGAKRYFRKSERIAQKVFDVFT